MPLSDIPGIPQDADLPRVVDYLIMLRRQLNDFLNHLDTLNVDELDASVVNTGTLNANLVSVAASDGSYSYSIDSTGIKASNGVTDTLSFDLATGLLTIVSALIQSASGYPRVELNSTDNLVGAFTDVNNSVRVVPVANTAPGLVWYAAGALVAVLEHVAGNGILLGTFGASNGVTLSPAGDVNLNPSGKVTTPSWAKTSSIGDSQTLQQALNAKQNAFSGYSGTITYVKDVVGSTNYYGTITVSNGIITSVS